MRAPISGVIPTLNSADALPETLAHLVEGLNAALIREVIVADGGSTDGTDKIATQWGCEIVQTTPSRGGQLRAGAQVAKGDFFLFLHSDTHLEPGWTKDVLDQLGRGRPCFACHSDPAT